MAVVIALMGRFLIHYGFQVDWGNMLLCYEDYAFEVIAHKIDTKKSRGDNSMMTQESVDEDFTEEKN